MLEQWALELAASPWVFAALFGFAVVDGIFPPVPSESVVIALASLSTSTGSPVLWAVVVVAAIGAFVGDQVAYQVGRAVPVRRLRVFRGRRGQAVLDWAERALRERGAAFIVAARYIPVGRVAVNMTAGALGFRRRRFVLLTAIAGATWAVYSTLIGIGTGMVLGHSPLVGVAVGVVGGFVIGTLVDWVLRRWLRIGGPVLPEPEPEAVDAPLPLGARPAPTVPAAPGRAGGTAA